MKVSPGVYLLLIISYFGIKYRDDIKIPMGGFGDTKEVIQVVTKDRQIPVVKSEFQATVQKLTDSLKSGPNNGRDRIKDATILGDLCGDFAQIVIKPNDAVKNSAELRYTWNKYLALHNSNNMHLTDKDYNDLAKQVDGILISVLGSEPKPIDNAKVIDIFTAMQGAFYASRI